MINTQYEDSSLKTYQMNLEKKILAQSVPFEK